MRDEASEVIMVTEIEGYEDEEVNEDIVLSLNENILTPRVQRSPFKKPSEIPPQAFDSEEKSLEVYIYADPEPPTDPKILTQFNYLLSILKQKTLKLEATLKDNESLQRKLIECCEK